MYLIKFIVIPNPPFLSSETFFYFTGTITPSLHHSITPIA